MRLNLDLKSQDLLGVNLIICSLNCSDLVWKQTFVSEGL